MILLIPAISLWQLFAAPELKIKTITSDLSRQQIASAYQLNPADGADNYTANPIPAPRHRFTVIAHRGDHVLFPENTLAAYEQAIKHGADYVEIDLRTTKDGELVSLHDARIDRMTNDTGMVKNKMLADIEKLSIKTKDKTLNLHIPTFKQILALCKNKIYIYIDFKEADPAVVYPLLKQYGMEKQVLVYINKPEQFTQWRAVAPQMPLMLSLPDDVKDSVTLMRFMDQYHPDVLDGDFKQYNNELVAWAKKHHLPAWPDGQSGAEGPEVWDMAVARGLTGLQTDHPEAFINYLTQKGLR
ncbi:glycerophosphoryl diester phosphodiesterase [Mucilaginibacter paludis DSM 18603]|uniref:Glycerophosphoryl diester phosphodiesterase n=2 Tax=Mucilaginibacter TaxID=423349 RepID=H1Y8F6_9SPHI|nr:glycerophosphoryl diester phosphodiesterase [Mucilaginibacter paludis DSM 18603]